MVLRAFSTRLVSSAASAASGVLRSCWNSVYILIISVADYHLLLVHSEWEVIDLLNTCICGGLLCPPSLMLWMAKSKRHYSIILMPLLISFIDTISCVRIHVYSCHHVWINVHGDYIVHCSLCLVSCATSPHSQELDSAAFGSDLQHKCIWRSVKIIDLFFS